MIRYLNNLEYVIIGILLNQIPIDCAAIKKIREPKIIEKFILITFY